ncbi:MAG: HyaD/HybD family hydrogenase maturation endopeptidase [Aquificae bacterium]|nr:HyaD/HybD family hydrogenase maturation endopeptidase [Aquificota bacterium]
MITVLGVGNILLSDEGLGVRAVEELSRLYELPPDVRALDGGTLGIDLMYHLRGTEKLIVVDAVLGGGEPGTIYVFKGNEVKKYFRKKVSAHELGIQEVLALMELTGQNPEEVVLIGMEPKSLELSTELSDEVARRIPLLVERIVSQLGKWGKELRRKAL